MRAGSGFLSLPGALPPDARAAPGLPAVTAVPLSAGLAALAATFALTTLPDVAAADANGRNPSTTSSKLA